MANMNEDKERGHNTRCHYVLRGQEINLIGNSGCRWENEIKSLYMYKHVR